jgi:hypothetical protein
MFTYYIILSYYINMCRILIFFIVLGSIYFLINYKLRITFIAAMLYIKAVAFLFLSFIRDYLHVKIRNFNDYNYNFLNLYY